MPLLLGNTASGNNAIAFITINNTSGSAVSNHVVPVTIPYNSRFTSNFNNLNFFLSGTNVQHWVGHHVTSTSAQVYLKVATLPTGVSQIAVETSSTSLSSNTSMFNVFTDFPTTSIPSGWEIVSNGANRLTDAGLTQGEIDSINNYTITPGALTLCVAGGGPVSILTTTSDVGVNVAVDTKATLVEDTFGVSGWGAIWEVGLHGQPVKNNILLKNGIKYRWDARYTTVWMGFVTSYSRTTGPSGVATVTISQATKRPHGRTIVVGDEFTWTVPDPSWSLNTANNVVYNVTNKQLTSKIVTLTTSAPHGLLVDDPVTVSGVDVLVNGGYRVRTVPSSTTFTYSVNTTSTIASTSSSGGTVTQGGVTKVKTVSYSGDNVTITYDNPGQTAVSTTSYTNAFPTFYHFNVWLKNHQSYLDGPYGGVYAANGLATNNGGWNNYDADLYQDGNGSQELTLANGTPVMRGAPSPAVWSLRYSNSNYRPYVNNTFTGRSYTVGTITKYVVYTSLDANLAYITTSGPHGLKVGDTVTVAGVGSPYNGTWTVYTCPTGSQFTFVRTNANVAGVAPTNPLTTSVTYTDTTRGLNGKALIASHIGAAVLNWVAVYNVPSNVSDPIYALAG
jgi:hypothetical protein